MKSLKNQKTRTFTISSENKHIYLFSKGFKKYALAITKVGGVILLLTGIAILTGQLQVLGFFILEYFPSLQNFG